jgi:hypothetical protein
MNTDWKSRRFSAPQREGPTPATLTRRGSDSTPSREEPKRTRMLSIHRAILVAAGLTLWYCGSTAVLPHLVPHASAKELGIGDQHNRRSEPTSVTQREANSDIAPGAPYSSATTPTVDSPEWRRDAAETARRDKELARKLNGVCRGC